MPRKTRYEKMRPAELAAARDEASLVYVPIGSTEYHGFHLPVGFDTLHAYELCLRVAEQTGGVVLPPTYWGTRGHENYAGSLLLQEETIAALVRDALACLTQNQYRLIVICCGHWPDVQGKLLREVAEAHMAAHPGMTAMVLDPFSLHPTDSAVEHAGRIETSVTLYLWPELSDMAALDEPGALDAISDDCVEATREYGEQWFEAVLGEMVRVVGDALCGAK